MRASLPPALCVLALCCLWSVLGNITNELKEKTASDVLDDSVPTVKKQEETNPSGHSALRLKGMKETSGYKQHGKSSGNWASNPDKMEGEEMHHVGINALQLDTSGAGNKEPETQSEQLIPFGAGAQVHGLTNERTEHIREDDHILDPSSELLSRSRVSEFPCPLASDIAPCICYSDESFNIDLDCSAVESEEQLANVFQQEFPFKELRGFNMSSNDAIRVLDNILNGITFTSIYLYPGPFTLQAISDYFLLPLNKTLRHFEIHDSQLTSGLFPFAILGEMTEIEYFEIDKSQLTWIPKILLPSVEILDFFYGLTDSIVKGTFPIRAGEMIIGLSDNKIESVEPGSFYFVDENSMNSNDGLFISLTYNLLTVLEAGTVPMRNGPIEIFLFDNQITSVAPGAFVMPEQTNQLSIYLYLSSNQLTTIDETVFGELMPFVSSFSFYDNPLTCGCDIAWIVTNSTYINKLSDDSTCASGTNVHALDPDFFTENCF